ncbi:hypothetical protein EYF80_035920 [Liparis tanakae]|uniref:Uncharacterized protein n=1 Tax=Liparis tanakae TaxID=230148 RepID=A0A4Z2GKM4_9TELE|nr:hypothetical protein EYF80_035920 [Liparis tanakae]
MQLWSSARLLVITNAKFTDLLRAQSNGITSALRSVSTIMVMWYGVQHSRNAITTAMITFMARCFLKPRVRSSLATTTMTSSGSRKPKMWRNPRVTFLHETALPMSKVSWQIILSAFSLEAS